MRFNDRNTNPYRIPIVLLLSFVFHAITLTLISLSTDFSENQVLPTRGRSLRVRVVSELPTKKKTKKKKKKKDTEGLQIVSAPRPEKEEEPDKPRFADRYASKVKKQSVKKGEKGSPVIANRKSKQSKTTLPKASVGEKEKENLAQRQKRVENAKGVEEGKKPQEEKEGVDLDKEMGEKGGQKKLSTKSLFPQLSDATHLNPFGKSGSNDYLRDVDEGSKTLLNRKRTRYWAFFDRVKTQITKEWSPNREYRQRDPFGDIYGVKDRYSVINVTLNSDGSVRRLYIDRKSGTDFLDEEALRAVKQASPYHNPPEGLKDEDGHIFFTFGFYFEIGTGKMRLFRNIK